MGEKSVSCRGYPILHANSTAATFSTVLVGSNTDAKIEYTTSHILKCAVCPALLDRFIASPAIPFVVKRF